MKPYKPWDFCKPDNCTYAKIINLDERAAQCQEVKCRVYRFHQHLRDNDQILEAGSELVAVVEAAQKRQFLINRRRELRADNVTRNDLIPGLAELIEAIHQADLVLEQALARLEE